MSKLVYKSIYDEDGAIISDDGRTLLKAPDVPHYRIKEGVEEIDEKAFKGCKQLKEIDVPYTIETWEGRLSNEDCMRYAPKGLKLTCWRWPYPENCIRSKELEKEIEEGWVDDFGAVYSKDKKRLLKSANIRNYKVREGTESVDRLAFLYCDNLQCIYFPVSCKEEEFDAVLGGDIGAICFWDRPYLPDDMNDDEFWYEEDEVYVDEYNVVYTKDRKRLLYVRMGFDQNEYVIPDGTVTICSCAFGVCEHFVHVSAPSNLRVIGDGIFGRGGGRIVIRTPKG